MRLVAMEPGKLRVCADPNNLPMSNQQGQGFENKLAEVMAKALNDRLAYTWWSQRKSFAVRSLDEGACDLVMGVPNSLPDILETAPYYRSTYVFVSRHDRNLHIASLADPRLVDLRIGIHVTGDDYAPPAYALAHRGITQNVVGFSLFGKYGEPNPPRKLIDAVEQRGIDLAIVWGPFAGYFAQAAKEPLDIQAVMPASFLGMPFTYDISMAVRKGNEKLKTELDRALEAESAAVQRILAEYAVPQVH
ncbi:MAG TPA: quinoprotein dehydrogenase-associated putative ABC transporter substrate-binding protein [Bryobacteraceae bacterium]|jgi:quinoprotein dehydrogenase-associated probable ABC transporter substrate-binding protein|nr:quinoprotein dehydrogenase-associated putative ABC transporter substrate-binding protein [Bryobacteraceae bacterium]